MKIVGFLGKLESIFLEKDYLLIRGRTYPIASLEEEMDIEEYDPSQKKALIAALTTEMTLIQGPPGTGIIYCLFGLWL